MTIGDGLAALAYAFGFAVFCFTLLIIGRPLTLLAIIAAIRGRSLEIERFPSEEK